MNMCCRPELILALYTCLSYWRNVMLAVGQPQLSPEATNRRTKACITRMAEQNN